MKNIASIIVNLPITLIFVISNYLLSRELKPLVNIAEISDLQVCYRIKKKNIKNQWEATWDTQVERVTRKWLLASSGSVISYYPVDNEDTCLLLRL